MWCQPDRSFRSIISRKLEVIDSPITSRMVFRPDYGRIRHLGRNAERKTKETIHTTIILMPEIVVKPGEVKPFKGLFIEAIEWFVKELERDESDKPFANDSRYSLLPELRTLAQGDKGLELKQKELLLSIVNKHRIHLEKEFDRLEYHEWFNRDGAKRRKTEFENLRKAWGLEWSDFKDN